MHTTCNHIHIYIYIYIYIITNNYFDRPIFVSLHFKIVYNNII